MPRALKSAAIGLIAAVAFAFISFAAVPYSNLLLGAYTAPIRIFPFFSQLQADVALAILFGQPTPSGLILLFALSVLFWTAAFAALYFLWSSRRSQMKQPSPS